MSEADYEEERRLCGEFWVWLYDKRRADGGREPSDAEKIAHPSHAALRALRNDND